MSARITPPWALPDRWWRVVWTCDHAANPCATFRAGHDSTLYRVDLRSEAAARRVRDYHRDRVPKHGAWMVQVWGERGAA